MERLFGLSRARISSRAAVVTRLVTDDGIEAQVYNGDNREHARTIAKIVAEELAPLCVGEDVTAVERIWETMFTVATPACDRKLVLEAIACVDTAVWDALGKSLGIGVSKLLGGYCDALPIIAIGGYYEDRKSPDDLAAEMAGLRARGLAGCKVKVGGLEPEADADRIAAAREGGGDGFVIAADANRGWDVDRAIRFARLVEPYGLAWFEEPCHWYDGHGRHGAGAPGVHASPMRGPERDHQPRRAPTFGSGRGRYGELRRLRERRRHRVAPFGRHVRGVRVRLGHHEEPQIALHLLSALANGGFVEYFADSARDPI